MSKSEYIDLNESVFVWLDNQIYLSMPNYRQVESYVKIAYELGFISEREFKILDRYLTELY